MKNEIFKIAAAVQFKLVMRGFEFQFGTDNYEDANGWTSALRLFIENGKSSNSINTVPVIAKSAEHYSSKLEEASNGLSLVGNLKNSNKSIESSLVKLTESMEMRTSKIAKMINQIIINNPSHDIQFGALLSAIEELKETKLCIEKIKESVDKQSTKIDAIELVTGELLSRTMSNSDELLKLNEIVSPIQNTINEGSNNFTKSMSTLTHDIDFVSRTQCKLVDLVTQQLSETPRKSLESLYSRIEDVGERLVETGEELEQRISERFSKELKELEERMYKNIRQEKVMLKDSNTPLLLSMNEKVLNLVEVIMQLKDNTNRRFSQVEEKIQVTAALNEPVNVQTVPSPVDFSEITERLNRNFREQADNQHINEQIFSRLHETVKQIHKRLNETPKQDFESLLIDMGNQIRFEFEGTVNKNVNLIEKVVNGHSRERGEWVDSIASVLNLIEKRLKDRQ